MSSNNFPLSFSTHLIFVAVAFIFFLVQFVRLRKKYEFIMAIAVAMTMLIYVKESKMWFYGVGILEIGLLILALIAAIVEKPKKDEDAIEADNEAIEVSEGEE